MSTEKNRCQHDSSKCVDWTITRRSDYKPGPNESAGSHYSTTRTFNATEKSSKTNDKQNISESAIKSTMKTNKNLASSTRNSVSNKSKSI
ncbi:unnamed protein product [Rotaria socialis]|uniref:Uncharacterized protein n=1 Tax=Rotaria socialis TaxID=392032 RepID=A0A817VKV0_9BILA|nr:unnamed protein product [Rotaria socialis]CAF3805789.1 unnamed protein product [Rotaria socialis]CAF4353876.1 unnamed protein product [Rotaria socialis]CAF4563027.1 unnamed protein product [Rotaria socialis]